MDEVKERKVMKWAEHESYAETYDDEEYVPEAVYDRYGNPTRDTIAAMYEAEHGITEVMTLDEFHGFLSSL